MTIATIESANTRVDDFEGAVVGTVGINGGGSPIPVGDFVLQGTNSWGIRITSTNTDMGWGFTPTFVTNMTAANSKVWLVKVLLTNIGVLDTTGVRVRVGSGPTAYYFYMLRDKGQQGAGEFEYPVRGGWVVDAIDPNVAAWRDGTAGFPFLALVDFFAITGAVTVKSDGENLLMDAIDIGVGLWGYGGTGADAFLTIGDFWTFDEGTQTSRFGHVSINEGVYQVFGKLTVGLNSSGSARAVRWRDGNFAIVFPGGRVDTGFNGVHISLAAAGSVVLLSNISMTGNGRSKIQRWFSTASEVDSALDEIISTTEHDFASGDAVRYSKDVGAQAIGLTDGALYFVERVSANRYSLHASRAASFTTAAPINLTASAAGSSEQHSFTREPDTRPDLLVDGTVGSSSLFTRAILNDFNDIAVNGKHSFLTCTFFNCHSLTLGPAFGDVALLSECTIIKHTAYEGQAFIKTPDMERISDCDFTFKTAVDTAFGTGHAIEVLTTGKHIFTNNVFSGYGPSEQSFDGVADVAANAITIGTLFTDGISNGHAVYYEKVFSSTVVIGLVDGARYFARIVTPGVISLHRTVADAKAGTEAITITGKTGQHRIASATAAVLNATGGEVTVSVAGGVLAPSTRTVGATNTFIDITVNLSVHVQELLGLTDVVGARVLLEAAPGGPLPSGDSVTIVGVNGTATVTHAGHGLVDGDHVMIRGANENAYNGDFAIFQAGLNSYRYTIPLGTPTTATGTLTSTAILLGGLTDANGLITDTFSYTFDQPVAGVIRKSSSSPLYRSSAIPGMITSTGFDATNLLILDE